MRVILLINFVLLSLGIFAQGGFYDVSTIQEIKIYFSEPNWDQLLDDLYIEDLQNRLVGKVIINGETFENVGVRYKGFSSYSSTRNKNPFNLKLDYIDEQNYQGYSKIKLSNVIQDPSFMREVFSYELAQKYMPTSKANFANVYVNDTLIGLYSNVESVNKDFLADNFTNKEGAFFKCNPENLDLSGENSNLSQSLGTDITQYEHLYVNKSNNIEDWNHLYQLINQLNNSPSNLESILNVDRTLWMHAFNYSVINFDSYVGYAQNYYIYQESNGQFNPILWDLNMSFASFRFSDASNHWDGFTIAEAKIMDPLLHYNSVSVYPRPFMRNLFDNDTYRRMYLAHIRTIIEENFSNQDYATRLDYLQSIIDVAVQNDTNKFYSYADFLANKTTTVSDLIDYPGLTDLMDARTTYLTSYTGFLGAPQISNNSYVPSIPTVGEDIWITADIQDANNAIIAYRFSVNDIFSTSTMYDDGAHHDGVANDGTYGVSVNNVSNVLDYYFYAENDSAGRFLPERAAYEFFTIHSKVKSQDLAINELMAVNNHTVTDEDADFDDWIEFYNTTDYTINTQGLFLSDDSQNPKKWALPVVYIAPNDYLIIWADEDTLETELHTNFKLDGLGENLILSYADGTIIDSLSFGIQQELISYGRFPNGTGEFIEMLPTYNEENSNLDAPLLSSELFIYPIPADDIFNIRTNLSLPYDLEIITLDGKKIMQSTISDEGLISVNASLLSQGAYIIRLESQDQIFTHKLIITH
jgi:hypothetical protein